MLSLVQCTLSSAALPRKTPTNYVCSARNLSCCKLLRDVCSGIKSSRCISFSCSTASSASRVLQCITGWNTRRGSERIDSPGITEGSVKKQKRSAIKSSSQVLSKQNSFVASLQLANVPTEALELYGHHWLTGESLKSATSPWECHWSWRSVLWRIKHSQIIRFHAVFVPHFVFG